MTTECIAHLITILSLKYESSIMVGGPATMEDSALDAAWLPVWLPVWLPLSHPVRQQNEEEPRLIGSGMRPGRGRLVHWD